MPKPKEFIITYTEAENIMRRANCPYCGESRNFTIDKYSGKNSWDNKR